MVNKEVRILLLEKLLFFYICYFLIPRFFRVKGKGKGKNKAMGDRKKKKE